MYIKTMENNCTKIPSKPEPEPVPPNPVCPASPNWISVLCIAVLFIYIIYKINEVEISTEFCYFNKDSNETSPGQIMCVFSA